MQHQWTVGAASSTHSVYITLHRLIIRFHWPRERRWWQLRRSYTDTAQKTGESSKDINSKVNIRPINSPSDWSDVPIIICIYIGPQLTGTYMQLKLAAKLQFSMFGEWYHTSKYALRVKRESGSLPYNSNQYQVCGFSWRFRFTSVSCSSASTCTAKNGLNLVYITHDFSINCVYQLLTKEERTSIILSVLSRISSYPQDS